MKNPQKTNALKSLALVCGVGAMGEGCDHTPLTKEQWELVHTAIDDIEQDLPVMIELAEKADKKAVFGVDGSGQKNFKKDTKASLEYLQQLEREKEIYGYYSQDERWGYESDDGNVAYHQTSPSGTYIAINWDSLDTGRQPLSGVLVHEAAHRFFGPHEKNMIAAAKISMLNRLSFAVEVKDFCFSIEGYIGAAEKVRSAAGDITLEFLKDSLDTLESSDLSEDDREKLEEECNEKMSALAGRYRESDKELWVQKSAESALLSSFEVKVFGINQKELEDIFREGSMSAVYEENVAQYEALSERYNAYLELQENEIRQAIKEETRGEHTVKRR